MICRLVGRLVAVREQAVELEVGGIGYEALIPAATREDLAQRLGETITLFTVHYLDGNLATGHVQPRLIGFLSEAERQFFGVFTKTKGFGMRKALRAMAVPAHQIAATIEAGDELSLARLPEIGKKTAAQIVSELRGQMATFVRAAAAPAPLRELTDGQRVALEILVGWGERRVDAQRLISDAVESEPELVEPDAIVRAVYKRRQTGG